MAEVSLAVDNSKSVDHSQEQALILANPQNAATLQYVADQYIKCISASLNSAANEKVAGIQYQGKTYIPVAMAYAIARNRIYKGLLKQHHPKDTTGKRVEQTH